MNEEVSVEDVFGDRYNYIVDMEGKERYVNQNLAANLLMKLYWAKHYGGDLFIFIGGDEGSGKSTLARTVAKLLDPTFDHTKIVYSYTDLKKAFFNDKPWEAIIYDESQEGVDRKESLSKGNRDFAAFMRQARQKHKVVIFCGPSIFDIDSYVALHRVTFLLQCYFRENLHPGHAMFFTKDAIKRLFIYDKKSREYNQKAAFKFDFSNLEVCDMEAYDRRKKAAFEKFRPGAILTDTIHEQETIDRFIVSRIRDWDEIKAKAKGTRIKSACALLGISRTKFWSIVDRLKAQNPEAIDITDDEESKSILGSGRTDTLTFKQPDEYEFIHNN
jgi:hypothetical protein